MVNPAAPSQKGVPPDPAFRRKPGLQLSSTTLGEILPNLFVDSCRLGPAPTRAREGAVVVTTVLLIALVVVLVQPPVLLASILAGLAALHLAIRWVLGMRKWDRR